ncbi:MAG: hypothetical protein AABZ64_08935 [Nitrospinota bacterium]
MTLEERMTRLERENRLLKRGFLGLALAAAAAVMMGQAAPGPQPLVAPLPPVVKIKRLEIIGDNGVPVVILGQHKSFGHIAVTNSLGNALVSLGTTRSGKGFVSTYDGRNVRLAAIGASSNGAGVFTGYSAQGRSQVRVGDNTRHEGSIILYDQAGGVRARWPEQP